MEGLMTEQPSVEALVERVRQAILRGSYDPQAGEWRAFFGPDTRDEAHAALDSLTAALEQLKRHDEAATQDAVFFRKGMVDAQEALKRAVRERDELAELAAKLERGVLNSAETIIQLEARAQKAEEQLALYVGYVNEYEPRMRRAEAVVEAARGIIGSKESQSPWGQDVLNALALYDEPPKRTHGRGCPCTPCQAEDWDAIDAGLRVDEPPTKS
jgi:hypothetical protein